MYRTLSQLRDSINELIEQQGEDAPVAAFVFTNEDVFTMDEDYNPDPVNRELAEKVLSSIEELDSPEYVGPFYNLKEAEDYCNARNLVEKCQEDSDLLKYIISEYVWGLSESKLDELEDFLSNNFGDD